MRKLTLVLLFLFNKDLPAQQTNLITPVSIMPQGDHLAGGTLRFWDKARAHYVGFSLDNQLVTSNIVWRLPATTAPGCLTNDGLNHLAWTTGCGTDVSEGVLITGYGNVTNPLGYSTPAGLKIWANNTSIAGLPSGNYAALMLSDYTNTALTTAVYLVTNFAAAGGQYGSFTFNGTTYVQHNLQGLSFFAGAGINATANANPFYIDGATSTNGNLLLRPGAVAGNASVVVNAARTDQPAMYLKNIAGTTVAPVLTIRDSANVARWWVMGSGDAAQPNYMVTATHIPTADNTHDLGMTGTRWRSGMFATRVQAPSIRPEYISGGSVISYWDLTGSSSNVLDLKDSSGNILLRYDGNPVTDLFSFSGDLVSNGNNVYSLGNATYAWANIYVGTRIYGTGNSLAINGPSSVNGNIVMTPGPVAGAAAVVANAVRTDYPGLLVINAGGVTTKAVFEIRDSTGIDLDSHRVFKVIGSGDSGCANCVVLGSMYGLTGNTYDIGGSTNRWRKQWINDIDFSGSLLVSGGTAIDASRNGYFVNATITTGIFGGLSIRGSAPQIDATGLGNALNINGAITGNGNIVLNPGNVSNFTSVYINGRGYGLSNQAILHLNETGGVGGVGISMGRGGAFDAMWNAGISAAFDVVLNNASTHAFIVLQTGTVLVGRTTDNATGAKLQAQGSISFIGSMISNGVVGLTTTLSCSGSTRIQGIVVNGGVVTGVNCL